MQIYLIYLLHDTRALLRNEGLKKQLDLSIFILGLMKSGQSRKNMIG